MCLQKAFIGTCNHEVFNRSNFVVVSQRTRHIRPIFIANLAGIEGYRYDGRAEPTLAVLVDHEVHHDALGLHTDPYGCSEAS